MIRVRSTDVWFNAPGIVCAYQPVAAPDSLSARYNVGNDARMAGRHTATSPTLPVHSQSGWSFTAASGQYLLPGCSLTENVTLIVAASSWTNVASSHLVSSVSSIFVESGIFIAGTVRLHLNNATYNSGLGPAAGVYGLSRFGAYKNGALLGSLSATPNAFSIAFAIGARLASNGTLERFSTATIPAFLLSSITFTPAHVAQYSRQMAYCHVNPDWSAWGRRRRYYYAPSQAGFLAAWAAHSNSQIGTGTGI